jgi:hypothetical protein
MTTLMLSSPPSTNSISSESQNERERPKTMVAAPNPATARSNVRPKLHRPGGFCLPLCKQMAYCRQCPVALRWIHRRQRGKFLRQSLSPARKMEQVGPAVG